MAYAYPSIDPAAFTTSLALRQSGSREGLRKLSDGGKDVISQFKTKINEDDIYIDFLQERIRVEKNYIDGLRRLYDRTNAIDSLHDDAPPPRAKTPKPSTRIAWAEVRDYTLREIQSREAMKESLQLNVVTELVKLKEEQIRIRHALRDNIKLANEKYDAHAKHMLPKAKKAYIQKCNALEDHKRQEAAVAAQARLLSTPSPSSPVNTPLQEHPFAVSAGPAYTSPPTVTAPLAPSSNPALDSHVPPPAAAPSHTFSPRKDASAERSFGNRLRASSGSGAAGLGAETKPKDMFNDIAAQGKKGFSAFMQKLGGDKDKEKEKDDVVLGGVEGEGLQRRGTGATARDAAKAMGAVRGARVKREADEADKVYRQAVFDLESLRLRREKLNTSAIASLEEFDEQLGSKLQVAMEIYMDTMHGTAATMAQATEVAREAVDRINLEQDMYLFRRKLRDELSTIKTAPVPYENFYVGPCRSLIFGVSLTDYDFARGDGSDRGAPPVIVEKCIAAIDERGLDSEGIYRVSGRHAGVQKLVQGVEKDEGRFVFEGKDDVFSVASVLKQYLRELPEPVFPLPHPERVKHTENRESHISSNFSALRGRLRRLPPIHQTTFQAIIEHLGRVQAHAGTNKMGAKNLAVVFNTVLFGQDQMPSDGNVLTMNQGKDTVLEDLITFSDLLFAAESPIQAPNVLPPGSALSRSGVISYHPVDDGPIPGSSRTKIKISQPGETPRETPSGTPKDTPGGSPVGAEQEKEREVEGEGSAVGTTSTAMAVEMGIGVGERDAHHVVGAGAYGERPATDRSLSSDSGGLVVGNPFKEKMEEVEQEREAWTQDKELELLFDPSLIPASMREGLADDIHIRPLASTDLLRNHFELLNDLRQSPALAPSLYNAIFTHLRASPAPGTYFIVVFVDKVTDQLVASGTLVVERKYINGGGAAGHLEDIVVAERMQGRRLGGRLVVGLREMAVGLGCYKVILDCKEAKIPFYEKCGFHKRSAGMAYYVGSEDHSTDASPAISPFNPAATMLLSTRGPNDTLAPPALSRSLTPLTIPDDDPTPRIAQDSQFTSRSSSRSSFSHIGGGPITHAIPIPEDAHTSDGEGPGSPKTFTSTSSGTGIGGVTYRFPTTADESVLPAWAAEGLGSKALSHPGQGAAAVAATVKAMTEGISGLSMLKADASSSPGSGEGHTRSRSGSGKGLGALSAESGVSSPEAGSPEERRRKAGTPLPPGAAPASTTAEPERI
ncbi:hypothetical protein IAT38_003687 [Cryptococcus sp. DSM 104549]